MLLGNSWNSVKISYFSFLLSFFPCRLCASASRYFSSRSANCCIPVKRARSLRTRAKTDTRISSPVSGAASRRFLCLSLPVETATQIDARPSSAMGREGGGRGAGCCGVWAWVWSLWRRQLPLLLSCTFNRKLFFVVVAVFSLHGFGACSRHDSGGNPGG